MFQNMMGQESQTDDFANYITPELTTLFKDWLAQMEEKIIALRLLLKG